MSDIGDDTDDKIRRNLVAFSSVIILGAWLGIPLKSLADKALVFGALDAVSPWRVWAAVVAVLVYLILRFRFSTDTEKAWQSLTDAWVAIWQGKAKRLIRREVARFNKTGKESSIFPSGLAAKAVAVTRHEAQNFSRPPEALGIIAFHIEGVKFTDEATDSADFSRLDYGAAVHQGAVQFSCAWSSGAESSGGGPVPFDIKGLRRYALHVATLWTLCLYSPEAMRLVFPSAIATVAAVIAVFKLGAAVFA